MDSFEFGPIERIKTKEGIYYSVRYSVLRLEYKLRDANRTLEERATLDVILGQEDVGLDDDDIQIKRAALNRAPLILGVTRTVIDRELGRS